MSRSNVPSSGCLFFLLLLTLPLAVAGAWAGVAPADKPVDRRAAPASLSSLPTEAQASVSAALGRDQRAYHAKEQGEGWRLANPTHGLRVDFTARGMEVQTSAARFGLRLAGLGRGARVEAVAAGTPEAKANRVEYRRGMLTEWYVNGPLGLEQGFTLERPPARLSGEALTLSLHLSGEMSAVPDPKGDGVALQVREGATVLRYRGLVAWDNSGRTLPAWWEVAGREVQLRIDDMGARYPLTIDPIIADARLSASDAEESDAFGLSVAMDGDTVVVAAFKDDIGANSDQGSAYVFVRPAGGWTGELTENAKLIASDGETENFFGNSVDVSGDTVVVGANAANVGSNFLQGSAYVFVRPATGWAGLLTENAKLTASDGRPVDRLGDSVGVSGDTVVATAPNLDQGSAYIFVRPAAGWIGGLRENAKLVASDGATRDLKVGLFHESVAISGDTVVLGAGGDDVAANPDQGSAYVFIRPAGGWAGLITEDAKLTASDGQADDRFGEFVDVSGDTVVVPPGKLGIFGLPAYVFVEPAAGWSGALHEDARLAASNGLNDSFVAASGDTVVVGANVFRRPAGGWTGTLTESVRLSAFVGDVAVSGDTVVSGFCFENTRPRSVCVFEGLETDTFEAEPATTQISCKTSGCNVPITCNLPQDLGTPCTNRVNLFTFVRGGSTRLSEDLAVKAPRRIKFAFGISNIPPGETKNIRLRLTSRGRKIARSGNRRLRGVIEIRNTPGDLIDTTPVRIRIRRK